MIGDVISCSHENHRGYPGQGVTSNLTCGGPGPGTAGKPCPGSSMQCQPGAASRGPGAQQFGVFPIPTAGENRTAFMYVGIRYGSAPDGAKWCDWLVLMLLLLSLLLICLLSQPRVPILGLSQVQRARARSTNDVLTRDESGPTAALQGAYGRYSR